MVDINADKTENVSFCRKFTNNKIITKLRIKGWQIDLQSVAKYLGVYLDSSLNFKTHLSKTKIKAEAVLKAVYHLMAKNSKLSPQNEIPIYKSIIRPIITYAAPVWCSISNSAMMQLQGFKNKCLRLVTKTETLRDYIDKLSYKFYKDRLKNNRLTRNIARIRKHNSTRQERHKPTYAKLAIYDEID